MAADMMKRWKAFLLKVGIFPKCIYSKFATSVLATISCGWVVNQLERNYIPAVVVIQQTIYYSYYNYTKNPHGKTHTIHESAENVFIAT